MKKSLLIVIAALFVAIGANAQIKRMPQVARAAQSTKVSQPMPNKFGVDKATVAVNKNAFTLNPKNSRRAVADIEGSYILDNQNFEGDFTASSSFTITAESGTAMVTNVETDADDVEFTYNVRLNDFTYSGGVAYGLYDETSGTIYVPVQTIFTHATYGRIVMSGVTKDSDGPAHIGFDMMFVVESDGNLTFYDWADELADAGYPEGEYMSGWYSYLPDYADGGAWNYGFDIEMFLPNGEMQADVSGYLRTDGQTSGWQDERASYAVYVEDFGTEYVVHNFGGMAPISVTVNGDGTCSIPLPQYVDDDDYSDADGDYGCMRLVGVDLTDDGYILRNYDKTELPGSVTPADGYKVVDFFELDGEGRVVQDADHSPYLGVATANDSEGRAYQMGYFFAIRLYILDSTDGINNVKAEDNAATGKIYNLAGQRVDNNYKGIVIKNGKKMIQK